MSRFQKIALFGFLLMLAGLVYLEASKSHPINWYPSYTKTDKIPLGTYVLHELMNDTFEKATIRDIDLPPYVFLEDSLVSGVYFFVNNTVAFDPTELDRMYKWVERGNTVFVSANTFSPSLLDTLSLELRTAWLASKVGTQPMLNLLNNKFEKEEPYHVERDFTMRYFEEIDTTNQVLLGVSEPYDDILKINDPKPNFLEAPVGDGYFYIHTQPEVFSNYFLLYEDHVNYTQGVLSYINTGEAVFWDNHYKSGKRINISPLHILFSNKYFKWAYYFVLIGAVFFVIFEGKRKQRSVKVVKPLTNKTYEYTRTISGMYLDRKENAEIAKKQIALFLEFVRTRLRIPTENINERFYRSVAARSGNTLEDTENLFTFIQRVRNMDPMSKETLIKLNKDITRFKKKLDGTN